MTCREFLVELALFQLGWRDLDDAREWDLRAGACKGVASQRDCMAVFLWRTASRAASRSWTKITEAAVRSRHFLPPERRSVPLRDRPDSFPPVLLLRSRPSRISLRPLVLNRKGKELLPLAGPEKRDERPLVFPPERPSSAWRTRAAVEPSSLKDCERRICSREQAADKTKVWGVEWVIFGVCLSVEVNE